MKKRMMIVAALVGVFSMQSDFSWTADPLISEREITIRQDQQPTTGDQSMTQQNHTEKSDQIKVLNKEKEQGPAPVILRIRLIDKTAD